MQQEVPRHAVRPVALDAVFEHVLREALDCLGLWLGGNRVVRHERGWVGWRFPVPTSELNDTGLVQRVDRAEACAGRGVVWAAAHGDLVILRGERESVDGRAGARGRVRTAADELEAGERVRLLPAFLVGEFLHEEVVPPPERLLFARVPVQHLREQPPTVLLGRLLVLGDIVREPLDEFRDALLALARLAILRLDVRGPRDRLARLGLEQRALRLEPVAEAPRRDAVVAVVRLDVREQLAPVDALLVRVAELQPRLELDDARARVLQVDVAPEAVERFQLLDGVGLDGRADALSHGAVQVDEDVAAQQLVHLGLAGAVAPGEALHGRRLVRGVVVDVHPRVAAQPVHREVDEGLERAPLGAGRDLAVLDRPERVESRRVWIARGVTFGRFDHAEEVVDTVALRRAVERVPLDVEEEVALRWWRQHAESVVRCEGVLAVAREGDALEIRRAPSLALDLHARLLVDALECRGARSRHLRGERQGGLRERGPRGDLELDQSAALSRGEAGHAGEVVGLAQLSAAAERPAADRAVVRGFRGRGDRGDIRRRLTAEVLLEAPRDEAVVGREVADAEARRLRLHAAEGEVHLRRDEPLHRADHVRVQRELEHGRRLRVPRELRVPDFVRPRAEVAPGVGWRVDAAEEVCVPLPPSVEEHRLVDHVGAASHRVEGCLATPPQSLEDGPLAIGVLADLDHGETAALVPQAGEEALLVLVSALGDAVEDRILLVRWFELPLGDGAVEVGEMHALDEADEIRRRVDQLPIDDLHGALGGRGDARVASSLPRG